MMIRSWALLIGFSWFANAGARQGALLVYLRHTSASLVIQENADPDVPRDTGAVAEA